MQKRSGFVLILTTLIIATSILLVSLIVNKVTAYRKMGHFVVDREKARMLALSGIEIAMGQLMVLDEKDEKDKKAEKADKSDKDTKSSRESPGAVRHESIRFLHKS